MDNHLGIVANSFLQLSAILQQSGLYLTKKGSSFEVVDSHSGKTYSFEDKFPLVVRNQPDICSFDEKQSSIQQNQNNPFFVADFNSNPSLTKNFNSNNLSGPELLSQFQQIQQQQQQQQQLNSSGNNFLSSDDSSFSQTQYELSSDFSDLPTEIEEQIEKQNQFQGIKVPFNLDNVNIVNNSNSIPAPTKLNDFMQDSSDDELDDELPPSDNQKLLYLQQQKQEAQQQQQIQQQLPPQIQQQQQDFESNFVPSFSNTQNRIRNHIHIKSPSTRGRFFKLEKEVAENQQRERIAVCPPSEYPKIILDKASHPEFEKPSLVVTHVLSWNTTKKSNFESKVCVDFWPAGAKDLEIHPKTPDILSNNLDRESQKHRGTTAFYFKFKIFTYDVEDEIYREIDEITSNTFRTVSHSKLCESKRRNTTGGVVSTPMKKKQTSSSGSASTVVSQRRSSRRRKSSKLSEGSYSSDYEEDEEEDDEYYDQSSSSSSAKRFSPYK